MDKPTIEDLAQRLDDLERQNLWLKRVGAVAIFGGLVLVALGTDWVRSPKQVTAEKFVLRDASGRARANLELRPDGAPTLAFLAPDGRDQVVLRAGVDGSSSLEYFEAGSRRSSLANVLGVGSSLDLHNRSPRSGARMYMSQDGRSGINFKRDLRGVGMEVHADGDAHLSFLDRLGRERGGMGLEPDGTLSLLGEPGVTAGTIGRAGDRAAEQDDPLLKIGAAVIPTNGFESPMFGKAGGQVFNAP